MTDDPPPAPATLDVTGLPCPRPVAVVRQRLATLESDEELVVVGDSAATAGSIRRACENHGYDVREITPEAAPVPDDPEGFALGISPTEFAELGGE